MGNRIGAKQDSTNFVLSVVALGRTRERHMSRRHTRRARIAETPHLVPALSDNEKGYEPDGQREIFELWVAVLTKMGTKRTSGKGGFIDSVAGLFEQSYGEVLQPIKP